MDAARTASSPALRLATTQSGRRRGLATDKSAAEAMLREWVKKVERETSGVADPFERQRGRPIREHLADYKTHLITKGNMAEHARITSYRIGAVKHRRRDVLPLRGDVAAAACEYLSAGGRASRPGRLWPRSWYRASAKMLRIDLKAAGIPYQTDDGQVFDFHALRHQFISNLARAGVHPKVAQALARHSTITLTLDRYTHVDLTDLTNALDRLPALSCSK